MKKIPYLYVVAFFFTEVDIKNMGDNNYNNKYNYIIPKSYP